NDGPVTATFANGATATLAVGDPTVLIEGVEHLRGMTFRYYLTQPLQGGHVVVTFIPASWSFVDSSLTVGETTTTVTLGTIVNGDAPFVAHLGPVAIIVPFPSVPAGSQVVLSSLSDFDEFALGGPGLGTVTVDTT